MNTEFIGRLIAMLEETDTEMIEDQATVEQLQILQFHAANIEEWARMGLKRHGAVLFGTDGKPSL